METIQATVNPRLLTKASRLFTGTLQGRIIEILQNARRAGATDVNITNSDGKVTVRDNGKGIDDFARLLDLGSSGWEQDLEQSEDPAGVGLFSLATRELTIRSKGRKATIQGDGWIGEPVEITDDPETVNGTILCFPDEPWEHGIVEPNAVFTGLNVTVDGKSCEKASFVKSLAAHYPELGCRIEVRDTNDLSPRYSHCRCNRHFGDNVFVNFHGQNVSFSLRPVSEYYLSFLVDMTGEPTGIRLMLPARTCLVENEAFEKLKAALEVEAYRYLQKRSSHRLPYADYLRAQELGITLPEAEPTFQVGLLFGGDSPEPVDITMPQGFPLAKCYRLAVECEGNDTDEANAHLLAAYSKFAEPFIPVTIPSEYDGYSWAKLPTIDKVEFKAGKILHESWLWAGKIACVNEIAIIVHTSDDRVWSSPTCMALLPMKNPSSPRWLDWEVLVTPEAQVRVANTELMYHLGGYSDDGDLYETQECQFQELLEQFWMAMIGPDEQLRCEILGTMDGVKQNWKSVKVLPNGSVTIKFKDGSKQQIKPPKPSK